MLITTTDLAKEPLEFDLQLPVGPAAYAPDVRQTTPLHVVGRADLLLEHRGPKEIVEDIRIRARVKGDFEQLCARCLDPVPQPFEADFDLIFRPGNADQESGERSITEEETEIGYYDGGALVLEDVVREQVLLSLPNRTLCGEECKGLCQHCGANLNSEPCHCDQAPADPRWTALADLSGKLAGKATS